MSLHADIVKILNSEGAASEGGWHSWRCFDKGRYPEPCKCTEVVASMVMFAALDAALEAVASMVIETAGNSAATVNQAIAAIDALREEKG